MSKVRFEAFLWGAGTALGELPPYFMAKVISSLSETILQHENQISSSFRAFQASRLSGYDPDDADDLNEFVELNQRRELGGQLSRMDRAKLFMEKIVEKVGFFGILAFASVSKIILRKPRKKKWQIWYQLWWFRGMVNIVS